MGWAKTYLGKAALIETVRRGVCRLSERGRNVLASKSNRIDARFLEQFPEYADFAGREAGERTSEEDITPAQLAASGLTPDEQLRAAYAAARQKVEAELLDEVVRGSPRLFEEIVVRLLLAMGYAGIHGSGNVVGKTGDGGVDGIIHQDALGLDRIYVQAKRWTTGTVGPEVVRAFAGTLGEHGVPKGVILTTSSFTKSAREFAERADKQIVLVDGPRLVALMFDFGMGVAVKETFTVKKLDTDFFQGEL
ncbi:MAG: restriction endonuclease [Myxococcota bacterium]|nr:restriction endonuclease [Myxococcota bacterium]